MNHDSEKWLDDRISEDVDRMADKRIKELMESEELKDIEATMDQLQSIRKRLGLVDAEDEHDMEIARELTPEVPAHSHVKAASEESTTSEAAAAKAEDASSDAEGNDEGNVVEIRATETSTASKHTKTVRRPHIRLRAALAAALVAILALGVGMVGSGKKVYLPVVSQREDGDESTTVVDNNEGNVDRQYNEEEVCQEIEDKLGVLPIRFGYRPKKLVLQEYWIKDDQDAILRYAYGTKRLHVYISKDYDESSINFKMDGALKDSVQVEAMFIEVPVYEYKDSKGNVYMQSSFEYLNTYYSIDAMMDLEEFEEDPYGLRLKETLGEDLLPVTGNEAIMEISKFSCSTPDDAYLKVLSHLEENFTPLVHDAACAEFVPKGFSKASGIEKTCELLGIEKEDTYAFGDSINDVEMLKHVQHGIAMGNGTKAAKEAADYITAPLHEDGIYKGLEHFGLIS